MKTNSTFFASFLMGIMTLYASASIAQENQNPATAIFAGGCFWCIEADFEKLEGVQDVVSGYTGGSADTANYYTVSNFETGHYEAVKVTYDPSTVSYADLVYYFWQHIDPTDDKGQFCDKGSSYRSAVFYASEDEKNTILESIDKVKPLQKFDLPFATSIIARTAFYDAEEKHQNYYKKNPIRYRYYRTGCGRDKRVKELWKQNESR